MALPILVLRSFSSSKNILSLVVAKFFIFDDRVLKSRIDEYPEGCVILYHGDWKILEKIHKKQIWYRVDNLLPDEELTRAVGVLGMPG